MVIENVNIKLDIGLVEERDTTTKNEKGKKQKKKNK